MTSADTLEEKGDGFATSLYSIPEIGQTREQYRQTVANARAHNISSVTPCKPHDPCWTLWRKAPVPAVAVRAGLALGTGYRRDVATGGTNYWEKAWDYGYEYSWLLGREIADPFFAKNPTKFAPWDYAKRVCLYPSVFETVLTAPLNTSNGTSTLIMMHFVAYVLGAAGIEQLPPPTLKTTDEASRHVPVGAPPPPRAALAQRRFGINIHFNSASPRSVAELKRGFSAIRQDFAWETVEPGPQRGRYNCESRFRFGCSENVG